MTILLLEDNPGDIYIISEQLKEMYPGYDLMVITNGKNARNYFVNLEEHHTIDKPDLIILDSKLPFADGVDLLAIIKRSIRLQDVIVVMLAGTDNETAREAALEMGAAEYFTKPIDLGDYQSLISRIINLAEHGNLENPRGN